MVLTIRGLAGEVGDLGPRRITWAYNRGFLLSIVWLVGLVAMVGIAGVGWHLYQVNYIGVVVSLLIAVIGVYLVLGTVREFYSLELLSKHMNELSEGARGDTLKSMLESNSNSMFKLVEALLHFVESILAGSTTKV